MEGSLLQEGWGLDLNEVRRFEKERAEAAQSQARKSRTRHADTEARQPKLKKRVPPSWFNSRNSPLSKDSNTNNTYPPWKEQHGLVEADDTNTPGDVQADAEGDHEMHDATYDDQPTKDVSHQSLSPLDQTNHQESSLTGNISPNTTASQAPRPVSPATLEAIDTHPLSRWFCH